MREQIIKEQIIKEQIIDKRCRETGAAGFRGMDEQRADRASRGGGAGRGVLR